MNKNALISLRGIRVDFDDEPVLKGIDLDIMDKEFITFLGPSGCCLLYTSDAADE